MEDIILENSQFRFTIGSNAVVKSLIHKKSGQECLDLYEPIPLCTVTQDRPYHNEIRLSHLCAKTTFRANSVTREGNRLLVGFEIVPYKAILEIQEQPQYVAVTFVDFWVDTSKYNYEGLNMDLPPVREIRFLQLPVKNRENFGQWLNVFWDDTVAVNLQSTMPHTFIGSDPYQNYRVFYAEAHRDVKLQGCTAVLLASDSERFLDDVDTVEQDFSMPRGVQSRRSKEIHYSIYRSAQITPENIDTHIRYAKMGGFRLMLFSTPSIFKAGEMFSYYSDYTYRPEYPNGKADVVAMLEKVKAAGLIPGFHFLHAHVGLKTKYVTPVADHRLHLKRKFMLAKPLSETDTTVFVCQNPEGCPKAEGARILQFDGELISYESFTTEPPYAFTGCVRGAWETRVTPHKLATWGGVLDVSEFGATSCYPDQHTDLPEELANIIAEIYELGFAFAYFDGSEGTNAPFDFHIPNAQLRVYNKLNPAPLFAEGAAKSHFSWHMITGGNAFDVFPMNEFKMRIDQYPVEEAPRMAQDFTRLNFGWWAYRMDTQPDHYEYGSMRAVAWDCPITMLGTLENLNATARTADTLEVLRRWEDVRNSNWLTPAQKEMLRTTESEHILLINEQGNYELVPYQQVQTADEKIRAFTFTRNNKNYAVIWHTEGSGTLHIPNAPQDLVYEKELGGERLLLTRNAGCANLTLEGRSYLSTTESMKTLEAMLNQAQFG